MAAILAAMVVGIHTQAPLSALACPPHESGYYEYPTPENCSSFGVLLVRSLWDLRVGTGWVLHHYRDDINALSTVLIAAFTGTLWWVTWGMVRIARQQRADMLRSVEAAETAANAAQDSVTAMREIDQRQAADFTASLAASQKAAEAADLSAKAAIGVEHPFLYVDNVTTFPSGPFSVNKWGEGHTIEVSVKNYGRTPAFVHEIIVNRSIGLVAPPQYKSFTTTPRRFVIPGGEPYEFTEYSYYGNSILSDKEIRSVAAGDRNLYVFGVIRFRDFLDTIHTRGFIFLYHESSGDFSPAEWWESHYYQT